MGDPAGPATGERRSERDLMRVAVVLGLVFFHTLRVFASGEYCVKHTPASTVVDIVIGLLVPWAMPLLFLISGIGTWYSLRSRGGGPFVVERLRRLLVPLVSGVVVLCPIPVWFEMNASPAYQESYWGFWRSFFRVSYEPGEFPFVVRPAPLRRLPAGAGWLVLAAVMGLAAGAGRRAAAGSPSMAPPSGWRAKAPRYGNEAVLPVYVLPQPVIVAIGFFVLGWGLPAIVEYLLISVLALAGTLLIYDLLVRRSAVTRFLFGVRAKGGQSRDGAPW